MYLKRDLQQYFEILDEMGLGKTCQAVIAVAILSSEGHAPALVICPLSVIGIIKLTVSITSPISFIFIDHWENEILR